MAGGKANEYHLLHQECINSANLLIGLSGLPSPTLSSISEINSTFFVALFEQITGDRILDLVPSIDSIAEAHNVQAVIDTLSLDLLGLSLSHISGENVVSGDPLSVLNLLELLETVHLYLFPGEEQNHKNTRASSQKRKVPSSFDSKSNSESTPLVDSKDVPHVKVSKKVHKRTLKKLCRDAETVAKITSAPSLITTSEYTPEIHDANFLLTKQNGDSKESTRKKGSKAQEKSAKYLPSYDVEQSNFEKKLRNLLMGDKSPYPKCQQLKQNFLKSLRTPSGRKSIPACRKSFLLPHNLRHLSNQQKPARRKSVMRSQSKDKRTSEKKENLEGETEAPAIFNCVLEEFPGFKFPPNTLELLKKRYHQHLSHMHRQMRKTLQKKPTILRQAEEAAAKQTLLSNILTKDLEQKHHLRALQKDRASANHIRSGLRDARMRSAKMRQYFNEFHSSMHSKMQQRNFTEEMIVERTFKEMLNLQKEKIRLLCQRVQETDQQDAKRHRQYLEALQHTYEQQLDMITESLAAEQQEEFAAEKEKHLVAQKMSRELRDKLQRDVRSLQKDILELMRDTHFREQDAQNFIASIP